MCISKKLIKSFNIIKMILIVILILYFPNATKASSTKSSSNVIDLTDKDFESSVAKNDTVLVLYFSSDESSEQSKIIEPEFETAANLLINIEFPVVLAKVDCNAELTGKQICSDNGIFVTPTLKIYKGGEFFQDYDGLRGAYDIFNQMKSKVGPNSNLCNTYQELNNALTASHELIVLGIFVTESVLSNTIYKQFLVASDRLRYSAIFIHTFHDSVYELESLSCVEEKTVPNIILIRPAYMRNNYEPNCIAYTVGQNIKAFVNDNYHGLVGYRTMDNKHDFKLPLIVVYLPTVEIYGPNQTEIVYYREIILKVAHYYKHITFAISNAYSFDNELKECGFRSSEKHLISVLVAVCGRKLNDRKFPMNGMFTEQSFEKFVNDFNKGIIKPFITSEPIPDDNQNAYVKVAVANNFEELVINSDKDTLLLIYSPGCRYCQMLEPIYEELGKTMFDEPGVQIVKINYAENDVPSMFIVHGFPTIYWYSSRKLLKSYDGPRDVRDFIRFIAKHSTNELKYYDGNGNLRDTKQEL